MGKKKKKRWRKGEECGREWVLWEKEEMDGSGVAGGEGASGGE